MKITAQAVPPEIAQAFARLVSTTTTGAAAGTITRTRRAARISPSKTPTMTRDNDMTAPVELLLFRLGMTAGTHDYTAAARTRSAEINTRNTTTP